MIGKKLSRLIFPALLFGLLLSFNCYTVLVDPNKRSETVYQTEEEPEEDVVYNYFYNPYTLYDTWFGYSDFYWSMYYPRWGYSYYPYSYWSSYDPWYYYYSRSLYQGVYYGYYDYPYSGYTDYGFYTTDNYKKRGFDKKRTVTRGLGSLSRTKTRSNAIIVSNNSNGARKTAVKSKSTKRRQRGRPSIEGIEPIKMPIAVKSSSRGKSSSRSLGSKWSSPPRSSSSRGSSAGRSVSRGSVSRGSSSGRSTGRSSGRSGKSGGGRSVGKKGGK